MMYDIDKLRAGLAGFADAALIISEINRFRFTGFPASDGFLLVTADEEIFYTDSRYTEAAANKIGSGYVRDSAKVFENLNGIFAEKGIKKVALEGEYITCAEYERLKAKMPDVELDVSNALSELIGTIRIVKSRAEVDNIISAQRIAEKAYDHILGFVKPGMTEKQVQLELDFYMLSHGADALSFETICITGAKTSMPHGVPGDNVIRNGDFVTLDFGALVNGCHSDMTRTFAVGEPTDEMKKVYAIVLEAQLKSLAVLKDGISGFDADKAARDVIAGAGYGDFFGHGTGHGVGFEIHEAPNLSPRSGYILHTGHIVTVEPGIYLTGRFGVRTEDMALVTDTGCENLTNCPKNLIIL